MHLLLAALLLAADAPKPNTLTPREAADGWLLLFDGETTFGWKIEGDARLADGAVVLGGDKETTATATTAFRDFTVTFEYRVTGKQKDAITAEFMAENAALRDEVGPGKSYKRYPHFLALNQDDGWSRGRYVVDADGHHKGSAGHIATEGPGSWGASKAAFRVPAGLTLSLRNIKLKPGEQKPLFNGNNLTGWKKYTGDDKRGKTELSVTPEGWLHLKNGPGDLQTEQLYDNFVLQVECKTNGNRLNSGVFFRCIPGEYQNGYEAQIHNGFDAEHPREYTIDEYDPNTNELKEKKKAKYSAIDYGTGAIYRRIPARKQAAKDNDWFTMTIVAAGRHIATWVNGIPMVDWTDNRPINANPRNGCRLEKGAISLQGHDPTTDIDFRNLRISELVSAKK